MLLHHSQLSTLTNLIKALTPPSPHLLFWWPSISVHHTNQRCLTLMYCHCEGAACSKNGAFQNQFFYILFYHFLLPGLFCPTLSFLGLWSISSSLCVECDCWGSCISLWDVIYMYTVASKRCDSGKLHDPLLWVSKHLWNTIKKSQLQRMRPICIIPKSPKNNIDIGLILLGVNQKCIKLTLILPYSHASKEFQICLRSSNNLST